jgi:aminopeptidase N
VWTGLALLGLAISSPERASAQLPGIDVFLYHFEVQLPDTGVAIHGTATVAFRQSAKAADSLTLDLVGMTVDSVLSPMFGDTAPHHFAYDGHVLRIPLPPAPKTGTALGRVTVVYHGSPADGLLAGSDGRGHSGVFADNWPERARYWLPTVDRPGDKAAVDFVVTAPAAWQVVANGQLMDTAAVDSGRTRWTWRERRPIPTYTMVVAAGPMRRSVHAPAGAEHPVPVDVWTWPDDSAYADSVPFREVTGVVDALIRIVGPFPYEKLSHIESATRYGGMENSSAIFYAEKPYQDGTMHEGVVRHETAHQWFGDAVTESDFHHLWLSEGFADYFDLVSGAALHGDSVLTQGMRAYAASYMKSQVVDRPIIDTAQRDPVKLLNANSYQKGAWVLHMLRAQIGDSTFFRSIRDYYSTYRDSSVLTAQFQAVVAHRSGKNLDAFFKQWLGQPGYPQLQLNWRYQAFQQQVIVDLKEVQPAAWGLFRLDNLPVEFVGEGGRTARRTIDVAGPPGTIRVNLPWTPTEMRVDPDGMTLLTATATPGTASNQ